MQKLPFSGTIELELDATIDCYHHGHAAECIVQYISEDCTYAIVLISDPRFCTGGDVTLCMSVPLETSPIRCIGRISGTSESEVSLRGSRAYLVRILITQISRINNRRLELLIAQKKAFLNASGISRFGEQMQLNNSAEVRRGLGKSQPIVKGAIENKEMILAEIGSLKNGISRLEETLRQQAGRSNELPDVALRSVLLLDDEVSSLNALKRTLRHEYNIFSALRGEDALAIMEREDIAVIIADQRMPGMTGIEFLERIMQDHPETIRVMLTAYTDQALLMDAINKVKVYRYIAKPWDPEEVRIIVREGIRDYRVTRAISMFSQNVDMGNQ